MKYLFVQTQRTLTADTVVLPHDIIPVENTHFSSLELGNAWSAGKLPTYVILFDLPI